MNKFHWFISDISLQTYIYDIIDINATFWHIATVYFACINNLLDLGYYRWLLYQIWTNKNIFWDIATNIKFKKNIVTITQIWHKAKLYCICISTWLPNMNKINPFFSEISQQIHKTNEKVAIIAQSMSNAWCLINVPNMNKIITFFWEISQQKLKIYEKNSHNYSNLAQSQILFYMH